MDLTHNRKLGAIAGVVGACGLLTVLSWPIVLEIWSAWTSLRGFHAHGIVMVGLVVHLLWTDRFRFSELDLVPSLYPGLPITAGAAGFWLLSWGMDFRPGEVLGFFIVFVVMTSALLGARGLDLVGTRLAILAFSLPVWFPLNGVLQSVASIVIEGMLSISKVVAYVEGNTVNLPNGVFEIEGGCSGLGFLLTSLSLTLYVIMSRRASLQIATICVAGAIAIALFANWLRIFLIIICGYHFGMTHPVVMEHVAFGWAVYAVLFFPAVYFGLGALDKRIASIPRAKRERLTAKQASLGTRIGGGFVVLVVAVSTPAAQLVSLWVGSETLASQPPRLSSLGYESVITEGFGWAPELEQASYNQTTVHADEGSKFMYFVAGYYRQPPERQIINEQAILVPPKWQVKRRAVRHKFTDLHVSSYDKSLLIRYWYNIGGEIPGNRLEAKWLRFLAQLRGRQDVGIQALATVCTQQSCSDEESLFDGLVRDLTDDESVRGLVDRERFSG